VCVCVQASVTLFNWQQYRHIELPGWILSWTWASKEVIWTMLGAEAMTQGDCSQFHSDTTQLRSQSEHRGSLTGSPLQPTSLQLLSRRSSRLFCTGSRQRRRRFPDHRRQIRQHQYHCQTAQELRSQNSWTRVHLRTRCQSRAQFVLDQRRTSPHSSFQCVASSSSPSLTTKFLLPLSLLIYSISSSLFWVGCL
jgi:hypothetical protein